MLKLHKRTHEPLSPTQEPPCPSHRIQFLDSPLSKRTRTLELNTLPDAETVDAGARSPQPQPVRAPESPFVSSKRIVTNGMFYLIESPWVVLTLFCLLDDVMALRPKRMRIPAAAGAPAPAPAPGQEKIFSVEDVRVMLQRAIEEHETYIRTEYNRVLQERLNGTSSLLWCRFASLTPPQSSTPASPDSTRTPSLANSSRGTRILFLLVFPAFSH